MDDLTITGIGILMYIIPADAGRENACTV